jgi:V8-like Glu-specific endopeptidase
MRAFWALGVISAGAFVACAGTDGPTERLGERSDAVVYGTDDRVDVYACDDETLRDIAHWSTVALVPKNRILRPDSGGLMLIAPPLGDMLTKLEDNGPSYLLCDSEPFLDQRALADCTGTLIDDDLVLTAAHCFTESQNCEDYGFVFDYFERADGELESVTTSDVFGCRSVVAHRLDPESSPSKVDFAIVQLDRAPLGRKPVGLRKEPLALDEPLSAIGYPSGLPAKIDQGARVVITRAAMRDYFFLTSDTFKGSSGSGIFDTDYKLAGVLVRGSPDYVPADGQDCLVSNVVNDAPDAGPVSGKQWEEATYVTRAIDALCEMEYPSKRLCNIAPSCGDGFCTAGENGESCAKDCTPESCGERCSKSRDPVLGAVLSGAGDGGIADADAAVADAGASEPPAEKEPASCALASHARPGASLMLAWLALAALLVRRRR